MKKTSSAILLIILCFSVSFGQEMDFKERHQKSYSIYL